MMKNLTQLQLDQRYKTEAEFLKKATKFLEHHQVNNIKVIRVVDRYNKGYSDLFINARGRLVCAELKDDTGTASPHQEIFIKEILRYGGQAGECRSISDILDLIYKATICSCAYGRSIINATKASPRHNYRYCPMCGRELVNYGL